MYPYAFCSGISSSHFSSGSSGVCISSEFCVSPDSDMFSCLDLSHALDASESGILMNRGTQVHNCCKEFHGSASCYHISDKTPLGDISTHTVQKMFLSGSGCLDRHKDARSLNT